jgi:hypothetical protein
LRVRLLHRGVVLTLLSLRILLLLALLLLALLLLR